MNIENIEYVLEQKKKREKGILDKQEKKVLYKTEEFEEICERAYQIVNEFTCGDVNTYKGFIEFTKSMKIVAKKIGFPSTRVNEHVAVFFADRC